MAFRLLQDCNDMDCAMSSTEHAVLMVLCRYANENGENCFPSTAEIARCSHFAENPVRRALASLQTAGWVSVAQRPGQKRFFTIDAARIKASVKVSNQQPLADQQPLVNQQGVSNQQPLTDQQPDPLQISKPTPCRSASRKEQEEIKEEVIFCDTASFESVSQSPDDFGFDLQAEEFGGSSKSGTTNFGTTTKNGTPVENCSGEPKKATKKPKAVTHAFNLDSLPAEWREVANAMAPNLSADQVFAAFRFYWQTGRGAGTLRTDKGWATSWANWVRKDAERPSYKTNSANASSYAEPVGTNSTDPAELRRQYWALQKQKREAEEREAASFFGKEVC